MTRPVDVNPLTRMYVKRYWWNELLRGTAMWGSGIVVSLPLVLLSGQLHVRYVWLALAVIVPCGVLSLVARARLRRLGAPSTWPRPPAGATGPTPAQPPYPGPVPVPGPVPGPVSASGPVWQPPPPPHPGAGPAGFPAPFPAPPGPPPAQPQPPQPFPPGP